MQSSNRSGRIIRFQECLPLCVLPSGPQSDFQIMLLLFQASSTELFRLADLQLIAPELILTVCACVALVMEVILPYRKSKATAYFALSGIALAALSLGLQWWFNSNLLPLD